VRLAERGHETATHVAKPDVEPLALREVLGTEDAGSYALGMDQDVVGYFHDCPFEGGQEIASVIELLEDEVADRIDGDLARVTLDPFHRDETSCLVVSLEVLRKRYLKRLKDVHARKVATRVVVADDRESDTLSEELKSPGSQQRHGRGCHEATVGQMECDGPGRRRPRFVDRGDQRAVRAGFGELNEAHGTALQTTPELARPISSHGVETAMGARES
jgi:hypothetical protein